MSTAIANKSMSRDCNNNYKKNSSYLSAANQSLLQHNHSVQQHTSLLQQWSNVQQKSKVSPSRRLKNLLKPLLGRVFKSRTKRQQNRNSYIAASPNGSERDADFEWLANEMDNRANEDLEQRLVDELTMCEDDAAIVVYNADGTQRLQPVEKDDFYVPVHFARTNAGTFFWTSLQRQTIEPYNIQWNFMDRWAQA